MDPTTLLEKVPTSYFDNWGKLLSVDQVRLLSEQFLYSGSPPGIGQLHTLRALVDYATQAEPGQHSVGQLTEALDRVGFSHVVTEIKKRLSFPSSSSQSSSSQIDHPLLVVSFRKTTYPTLEVASARLEECSKTSLNSLSFTQREDARKQATEYLSSFYSTDDDTLEIAVYRSPTGVKVTAQPQSTKRSSDDLERFTQERAAQDRAIEWGLIKDRLLFELKTDASTILAAFGSRETQLEDLLERLHVSNDIPQLGAFLIQFYSSNQAILDHLRQRVPSIFEQTVSGVSYPTSSSSIPASTLDLPLTLPTSDSYLSELVAKEPSEVDTSNSPHIVLPETEIISKSKLQSGQTISIGPILLGSSSRTFSHLSLSESVQLEFAKGLSLSDNSEEQAQKRRMTDRLELYGLKNALVEVPGDGNCLFSSLSFLLYGTDSRHQEVRNSIVDWLKINGNYEVSPGQPLSAWVTANWSTYCQNLAQLKTWGDHVVLLAAAEIYHRDVIILSSVPGDKYVFHIASRSPEQQRPFLLAHWHERHYQPIDLALADITSAVSMTESMNPIQSSLSSSFWLSQIDFQPFIESITVQQLNLECRKLVEKLEPHADRILTAFLSPNSNIVSLFNQLRSDFQLHSLQSILEKVFKNEPEFIQELKSLAPQIMSYEDEAWLERDLLLSFLDFKGLKKYFVQSLQNRLLDLTVVEDAMLFNPSQQVSENFDLIIHQNLPFTPLYPKRVSVHSAFAAIQIIPVLTWKTFFSLFKMMRNLPRQVPLSRPMIDAPESPSDYSSQSFPLRGIVAFSCDPPDILERIARFLDYFSTLAWCRSIPVDIADTLEYIRSTFRVFEMLPQDAMSKDFYGIDFVGVIGVGGLQIYEYLHRTRDFYFSQKLPSLLLERGMGACWKILQESMLKKPYSKSPCPTKAEIEQGCYDSWPKEPRFRLLLKNELSVEDQKERRLFLTGKSYSPTLQVPSPESQLIASYFRFNEDQKTAISIQNYVKSEIGTRYWTSEDFEAVAVALDCKIILRQQIFDDFYSYMIYNHQQNETKRVILLSFWIAGDYSLTLNVDLSTSQCHELGLKPRTNFNRGYPKQLFEDPIQYPLPDSIPRQQIAIFTVTDFDFYRLHSARLFCEKLQYHPILLASPQRNRLPLIPFPSFKYSEFYSTAPDPLKSLTEEDFFHLMSGVWNESLSALEVGVGVALLVDESNIKIAIDVAFAIDGILNNGKLKQLPSSNSLCKEFFADSRRKGFTRLKFGHDFEKLSQDLSIFRSEKPDFNVIPSPEMVYALALLGEPSTFESLILPETCWYSLTSRTLVFELVARGELEILSRIFHQENDSIGSLNRTERYSGMTPLHLACLYGHKAVAKLLLQKGAVRSDPNQNGHLPLDLCSPLIKSSFEKIFENITAAPIEGLPKLRLYLVGDPCSGKTSLLKNLCSDLKTEHSPDVSRTVLAEVSDYLLDLNQPLHALDGTYVVEQVKPLYSSLDEISSKASTTHSSAETQVPHPISSPSNQKQISSSLSNLCPTCQGTLSERVGDGMIYLDCPNCNECVASFTIPSSRLPSSSSLSPATPMTQPVEQITPISFFQDDRKINVQIWDIAGQEVFRNAQRMFFDDGQFSIYFIVIDASLSYAPARLQYWLEWFSEISQNLPKSQRDESSSRTYIVATHAATTTPDMFKIFTKLASQARLQLFWIENEFSPGKLETFTEIRSILWQKFQEELKLANSLNRAEMAFWYSLRQSQPHCILKFEEKKISKFENGQFQDFKVEGAIDDKILVQLHQFGYYHVVRQNENRSFLFADPSDLVTILRTVISSRKTILNQFKGIVPDLLEEAASFLRYGFIPKRIISAYFEKIHELYNNVQRTEIYHIEYLDALLKGSELPLCIETSIQNEQGYLIFALMDKHSAEPYYSGRLVKEFRIAASLSVYPLLNRVFEVCHSLDLTSLLRDYLSCDIINQCIWKNGYQLTCTLNTGNAEPEKFLIRFSFVQQQPHLLKTHKFLAKFHKFRSELLFNNPSADQLKKMKLSMKAISRRMDFEYEKKQPSLKQPNLSYNDQKNALLVLDDQIEKKSLTELHAHLLGMGSSEFWIDWIICTYLPSVICSPAHPSTQFQYSQQETFNLSILKKSLESRMVQFLRNSPFFEQNELIENPKVSLLYSFIDLLENTKEPDQLENFRNHKKNRDLFDDNFKSLRITPGLFSLLFTDDVVFDLEVLCESLFDFYSSKAYIAQLERVELFFGNRSAVSFRDWWRKYIVFNFRKCQFQIVEGLPSAYFVLAMEKSLPLASRSAAAISVENFLKNTFSMLSHNGQNLDESNVKNYRGRFTPEFYPKRFKMKDPLYHQHPLILSILLANIAARYWAGGVGYVEFSVGTTDAFNPLIMACLARDIAEDQTKTIWRDKLKYVPPFPPRSPGRMGFEYNFLVGVPRVQGRYPTEVDTDDFKAKIFTGWNFAEWDPNDLVHRKTFVAKSWPWYSTLSLEDRSEFISRMFPDLFVAKNWESGFGKMVRTRKGFPKFVGFDLMGDEDGSPFSPFCHRDFLHLIKDLREKNPNFGVRFHAGEGVKRGSSARNQTFTDCNHNQTNRYFAAHLSIQFFEISQLREPFKGNPLYDEKGGKHGVRVRVGHGIAFTYGDDIFIPASHSVSSKEFDDQPPFLCSFKSMRNFFVEKNIPLEINMTSNATLLHDLFDSSCSRDHGLDAVKKAIKRAAGQNIRFVMSTDNDGVWPIHKCSRHYHHISVAHEFCLAIEAGISSSMIANLIRWASESSFRPEDFDVSEQSSSGPSSSTPNVVSSRRRSVEDKRKIVKDVSFTSIFPKQNPFEIEISILKAAYMLTTDSIPADFGMDKQLDSIFLVIEALLNSKTKFLQFKQDHPEIFNLFERFGKDILVQQIDNHAFLLGKIPPNLDDREPSPLLRSCFIALETSKTRYFSIFSLTQESIRYYCLLAFTYFLLKIESPTDSASSSSGDLPKMSSSQAPTIAASENSFEANIEYQPETFLVTDSTPISNSADSPTQAVLLPHREYSSFVEFFIFAGIAFAFLHSFGRKG